MESRGTPVAALGGDDEERKRIRLYRKAVESAAAGKLGDSFERLDKMGAIFACDIGEQADKLADEYLRLPEQNASATVVSQTWGEVHRVNSRVRENSFQPDAIERQLAQCERNKAPAAYNHAQYLPERRKMMQWWANYLDGLSKQK